MFSAGPASFPSRYVLLLGLLISISAIAQENGPYDIHSEFGSIRVEHFECSTADIDHFSCRLEYSYDFPGRTSVYVDGIGLAPAQAHFRYRSRAPFLKILDQEGGKVIATAKLRETGKMRSGLISEFPAFSDFPPAPVLSGIKPGSSPFSSRLDDVLNRMFPGYDGGEIRQNVHYSITSYATIPVATRNLVVQVAVMVSNPDPSDDNSRFRVRWTARERNRLEDKWRSLQSTGPEADAVVQFVRGVLQSLVS